ncbi:MAG: VapE domain-containing protein [Anaerolineales bacterium]
MGAATLEVSGKRRVVDDEVIQGLLIQLDLAGVRNIARANFIHALNYVAKTQRFNSLQEWLQSLSPWDGVPRVEKFFQRYFNMVAGNYEAAVARYFWTAMVARITDPSCKAGMVPVLVGSEGAGKSSALQILAPGDSTWTDIRLTDKAERLTRKLIGRFLVEWRDL